MGPAKGEYRSMTGAMEAVTASQRERLGNRKTKKGLPASGWEFWAPVRKQRASA